VVAIKDATGGIQDALRLLEAGGIRVFTAHDTFVVPLMAVGASGIISVACNVCPDLIVRMVAAARAGDFAAATACHNKLVALQAALVLDTNPSGSKYALYKMGVISSPATRAPVAEFAPEYRPALDAALAKAGLLPE
jgi:4-hydroxy-tetrahydrodipicolinate synthase